MVIVPKPELKGFVIFNPDNDLFSGGGQYPPWRKKPKIWGNIGHVKNHLLVALDHGAYRDSYSTSKSCVNDKKEYRISNRYLGCIVYDIVTDKEVDFDIYQYMTDHFKKSYYGKEGYTIIYV
jgi:hypothetical protein